MSAFHLIAAELLHTGKRRFGPGSDIRAEKQRAFFGVSDETLYDTSIPGAGTAGGLDACFCGGS